MTTIGRLTQKQAKLIEYLKHFYENEKRIPTLKDFTNNPKYYSYSSYYYHFGKNGWNTALRILQLDIDNLIEKNFELSNSNMKGRKFERIVYENFSKEGAIDLSGKNCRSPFDGICPLGKTYDAKSSSLHKNRWKFHFKNKKIDSIDYFFLGGFDEEYKSLLFVLLIPKNIIIEKIGKSKTLNIYKGRVNYKNFNEYIQYDVTTKFTEFEI